MGKTRHGAVGCSRHCGTVPRSVPARELGLCFRALGIAHRKAACGGERQPVLGRPLTPPQVTYPLVLSSSVFIQP